jgi:hypothetical protein
LRALVDISLTSKEVAVAARAALALVRLAFRYLDAVRLWTRFGIAQL